MWQLAHLASGALIGQQAQNPALAFAFGVGAHLLLDKVPHYWPKEANKQRLYTGIEYLLALSVLVFVVLNYHTNETNMIWGIVGSLAVDPLLVGVPWLHHSKIGQWHHRRQPHRTDPLFVLTDAMTIVICLTLLMK